MDETTPVVRDHVLVRPIGEGGFGKVWLARSEVGTYRAVKIVSRSAVREEHDFNREFSGMQRFEPVSRSHEGLVDILQIGRAADDSYFYYVMELGDDVEPRQEFAPAEYRPRTLAAECRRRKRIPAVEAALIGAQLADALGFLHDHGLIHRDIKPSNVLFVQGHARIGDPGLVVAIEASQSMGGTLGYIAPEGPGTPSADIFGLGKLLYVASTGKEPGEFPLLPTDMTSYADAADLRRLNLIVLRACSYNPADRYASALELRKDLLEVHAGGSPGEIRQRLRIARRVGAVLALALVVILGFYFRAQLQAKAERTQLARSHKESAIRLQDDNDTLAALPYLGSMLMTEPDDDQLRDAAARRIGFIWRHGPRLCQQWYFGNAVNRVAFSPSGHELAIASASGNVWRWRWLTQPPAILGRHENPGGPAEAESVSYSADGRWIASVGDDSTLRLWPLDDRDASPKTIQLESSAHAVTFHPKEGAVAIGCENGQILLMHLHEPKPIRYLLSRTNDAPSGKNVPILSLAFSPDGRRLVAGGRDGWIRELDLAEEQPIRRRKLLWVYDVALNRDGSLIAAASDHRAYLNPFSGVTSAWLRHRTFVRSVSFDPTRAPGEDRLLTSCFDRTVRLWSCADDVELIPPIHTDRQPSCAIFSPDGQFTAIATISGLVRVYHHLPPTMGTADRITTTVAPDGSHYARVHDRTNVVVFESTSNSIARKVSVLGPPINRVDLSRNGTRMLTRHEIGKDNVRFAVWGPDADRPIALTNMQREAFAWWNPEGDCVVIHRTNALILWQPAQGTSSSWPWSIADIYSDAESRFSETSRRLVAAWGKNVMVLSTTNNAQITYHSFPYKAASVDIDPTGTRIVVGESPEGLTASQSHVWSIPDWKAISPPLAHEDGIFHARFSPSGRWLLLADQSGGCTVYDTSNWVPIPLRQHFGMITDATFSHDERFVATLTGNRAGAIPTIRVWELPSGDPATSLMRADAPEWGRLKFLGQDTSLCWSAPSFKYWHQWRLEKLTASSRDLADLAQLLSCRRVTASGVSVPLEGRDLQQLWLRLWESHRDWFALTNR